MRRRRRRARARARARKASPRDNPDGRIPMTYCCGLLLEEGFVMIGDTRTNAGVDNISTFKKLHVFEKPGEAVLLLAAAGNLSTSQSVLNLLAEGFADSEAERPVRLVEVPSMLSAAQLTGAAARRARAA